MALTTIVGRARVVARLSIAFVFAALLLGVVAGGASADTSVERREWQSARAWAGEVFLDVSNPGKLGGPAVACLAIGTADTYEAGCAEVADTFVLADHLSSASLAPTSFDLYAKICEGKVCEDVYSRTVVVEAGWTAAGPTEPVHELIGSGGPGDSCTTAESVITGKYRPATATVVIDGATSEGTGDLQAVSDLQRRTCR